MMAMQNTMVELINKATRLGNDEDKGRWSKNEDEK